MSDERNPYQAPVQVDPRGSPKGERIGIGPWLTGLLWLIIIGNVPLAGFIFFARERVRAADPLGPEWSFVARGIFAICMAAAAGAMLLRRRSGLYAYYLLVVLSMLLNISRGLSVGRSILSAAAPAALMAILVRKRMAAFDRSLVAATTRR
jgi:hypothetical protein